MENQTTTSSSAQTIQVKPTHVNGIKIPKKGDIVILHMAEGDTIQNNYSKEMPAIVVASWNDQPPFLCNLKGLPDGTGTIWRTSVSHQQGIYGAAIAQAASWRWPDEELVRGDAPMKASE